MPSDSGLGILCGLGAYGGCLRTHSTHVDGARTGLLDKAGARARICY